MKDRILAGFLALIFGSLGFHKFYLNRPFQGVIYLLLSWTFIPAVISFFEALAYFFQSDQEFARKYNSPQALVSQNTTLDDMKKLADLRDRGVLTEAEFQAHKEELLKK